MQNVGNISFRANSSGPKKSANSSCVNINTSAANSDNKKENRSKIANLIAGFFTGAFINKTITNMPGNFIFPEIFSKIDRLNKNLSKNEIQQIEETASKAIKTSELSKKGVEIRFAFEKSLLSLFNENGCPAALNLKTRCLIFPLYPMLSAEDCKVISRLITTVS